MALIITPRRLREQSEFYHQLASMVGAGLPLMQAAEVLRRSPPNRRLGAVAEQLIKGMSQGATFTDAMQMTGRHLPEFDIALIEAGESSGRPGPMLQAAGQLL
jgi:type II secretory pathway component PulF